MRSTKHFIFICILLLSSCKGEDNHENSSEEGVHYYTCSMDPQIKEDHPGTCPICHMDLTPIKENKSAQDEIELSEQQVRLGNVSTLLLEETNKKSESTYNSSVEINQENTITIAARAKGRIEALYVKTEGEYIEKNQALYKLYSEDVAIIKQDLLIASKQKNVPGAIGKNATEMLNSAKRKLSYIGLLDSQVLKIIEENDQSPNVVFYSTGSGYVSEVNVSEGNYVMEGSPLLVLSDLSSVWLEIQVNVSLLNRFKLGQKVTVQFPGFPLKKLEGKISFINPKVQPNSRLVMVRVELPNKELDLKIGMQGLVTINQEIQKGIFIPSNALIREENATYVWIEKEEGLYQNKMVQIGQESEGWMEIKSGLEIGQRVVITGAYAINSEYKFRKGANPMEGHDMSKM